MNLDVSPSGDQIVFDLLGDLYLLPIEGGQATSITNGLAWDMQPTLARMGRTLRSRPIAPGATTSGP